MLVDAVDGYLGILEDLLCGGAICEQSRYFFVEGNKG
jgi:hypothetical protein